MILGWSTSINSQRFIDLIYSRLQNDRRFAPELKYAPPSHCGTEVWSNRSLQSLDILVKETWSLDGEAQAKGRVPKWEREWSSKPAILQWDGGAIFELWCKTSIVLQSAVKGIIGAGAANSEIANTYQRTLSRTVRKKQNDRKVVLRSPIQWLAEATNPKGLVLVSSGPIDHFTAKYDSRVRLNPIPCALSTFIITITNFAWQSCAESLIFIAEEEADEEGERSRESSSSSSHSVFDIHYCATCHKPIWWSFKMAVAVTLGND
ncbi:hypothetical protein F5888DRAFT_1637817 [Russula emetica]|nr:hypothetical protein F5888DRAFT_1637817 [Russula emetica]